MRSGVGGGEPITADSPSHRAPPLAMCLAAEARLGDALTQVVAGSPGHRM